MKLRLVNLVMKLNEAEFAAQRLCSVGIIRGNGVGDFNLAEVLTYEELAVILTRLDGAGAAVQAKAAFYSVLAEKSGVQAWASAYVGYCIERGYFDADIFVGEDNRATIEAAAQIMSRHAGAYDLQTDAKLMGEYLLRGEFFRLIDDGRNSRKENST